MFYFFYGKNEKQKEKAVKLFESLKAKKPDATFLVFDDENITKSALDELVGSQGLFEKKIVCLFRNISKNEELNKDIFKKAGDFAKSENIFIWSEVSLKKDELSALKKLAEKSDVEEEKEKAKNFFGGSGEFNIFSLADAFGNRDKKKLWELFLKAREKATAEEIHGVLFWQLKAIAGASFAKDATDADLKPFVYSKAKGFSRNFNKKEIEDLSMKFVEMYHDAHRGKVDFMLSLEEFVLGV